MKIAINCSFFQPKGGGIKEYIQNLVENISLIDKDNEYVLYVLKDNYQYAKKNLNTKFKIKPIPFKGNSFLSVIYRSLFQSFFWAMEERKEKWDIFHSPFFYLPRYIKSKKLITVHDMRFYRFPETYTFFRYQFLKRVVKQSINSADKVIAISQFTKDEIKDAYGTIDDKITVIHEAINQTNFAHIDKLNVEYDNKIADSLYGQSFILSVGHLEPRKNFDRLIDAFEIAQKELKKDTKLVIVGKLGHHYDNTLKKINKNNNIIYLDFVSSELLNWLYESASLFVFPSIYEGFGFPPLEAGIHNTISAVSNLSSIPEICGEAVAYFDPYDTENMAKVITKCMKDSTLRRNLKDNIQRQIHMYSWQENAKKTISLYSEIYPN